MRALLAYARNDPSALVFADDVPVPTLAPDDVLVRVYASGVTPAELDWPGTWIAPDGAPRTPPIIPGHEVSGVVERAGPTALGIAPGDEVYGLIDFPRDGADAEFVAVRAADLASKPASLTHLLAASVPLSGLTAWQALFEHGGVQPGERVLIHGGGGGVGSFAVQLARWRGAQVTATASARDADLVRELGADTVIDYRAQRFEDEVTEQDLVFDTVGGETWERSWSVLRPGGRLVSIAVPVAPEYAIRDGRRAIWFVVEPNRGQLAELGRLIDGGQLRPIVSSVLPLAEGAAAYGAGHSGRGPGKTVLLVASEQEDPAGLAQPVGRATPRGMAR